MAKKVTEIILGLENCQELIFNIEDVHTIELHGITKSLGVTNAGTTHKSKRVGEFILALKDSANNIKAQKAEYFKDELPFERLMQYGDIVDVTLVYDDGKRIKYYIDWGLSARHTSENTYQSYYLSETPFFGEGTLWIVSDKNKTAKQYLGLED